MSRLSELRIHVGPVGHKNSSDARVVTLRGHVQRRLPIGCAGRYQSGPPGQPVGDSLRFSRRNRREHPGQIGVVRRDRVGCGAAPNIWRNDLVELFAELLNVGFEFSPARKTKLPSHGKLCVAQTCVWIAEAERIEASLAQLLKPLEVGAEGKWTSHTDTFFPKCSASASHEQKEGR